MKIELDEYTKAQVIEQAKQQAVSAIISQFDFKQIGAEIRNQAVKQVAALIAAKTMDDQRVREAIHRAVQSVESRINHQIHQSLKDGISIRFSGLLDTTT